MSIIISTDTIYWAIIPVLNQTSNFCWIMHNFWVPMSTELIIGMICLALFGGYVFTSLLLLRFPTLVHEKKKTKFKCRHISHRGGKCDILTHDIRTTLFPTVLILHLNVTVWVILSSNLTLFQRINWSMPKRWAESFGGIVLLKSPCLMCPISLSATIFLSNQIFNNFISYSILVLCRFQEKSSNRLSSNEEHIQLYCTFLSRN